jgi:transcriptional regulator with XRE-family HTH domain
MLRAEKGLSQSDIEERTGLMRCYLSRLENGHTVPSLETLERLAAAFDVPLYKIFYSDTGEAPSSNLTRRKSLEELAAQNGKAGDEARFLLRLRNLWVRLTEPDRDILLTLARKMATR